MTNPGILPCLGGPHDGELLGESELPKPGSLIFQDADEIRWRRFRYVRAERRGRAVWLWQEAIAETPE